jgi:SAM-dependent methyltransferase
MRNKKNRQALHGTPIEQENNLLDRVSNVNRFSYYYNTFLATEVVLVKNSLLKVIPRGKVLNVGCGRNGTERSLFPTDAYEIYGTDISEESLRILHKRNLYNGVFRGSITSLPLASDSFDVVYLRLILHHLVYPNYTLEDGLRECFRVLKPGGILALVEPNSWHPVGALMNLAHVLGLDMYIHGTDDDVALSPRLLRKVLARFASDISTHVVTYSWRRMPIPIQDVCNRVHGVLGKFNEKVPYFGHTLMMTAVKW